jgi:hypothetical protein
MIAVLDELGMTELVTSIQGLTAVGTATLLAETGGLTRFASPRAVVKHAGLCPRHNASGAHQCKTSLSGRGRPSWDWPPGAQCGRRCPTTPSSPRGSTTSPPGRTTDWPASRPEPPARPRAPPPP